MMGITQREVAALMGQTQSPVGALESKKDRQVSFEKLEEYAKALGFKVCIGIEIDDADEES